jgi:hypothetical protein
MLDCVLLSSLFSPHYHLPAWEATEDVSNLFKKADFCLVPRHVLSRAISFPISHNAVSREPDTEQGMAYVSLRQ